MAPPPQDEGEVPAAALSVPAHVIARVFSQLDCVDLLSCSLVCKQWYRDSAELRDEWRKEYMETWNLQGLNVKSFTQSQCPTCSIRSLRICSPFNQAEQRTRVTLHMSTVSIIYC